MAERKIVGNPDFNTPEPQGLQIAARPRQGGKTTEIVKALLKSETTIALVANEQRKQHLLDSIRKYTDGEVTIGQQTGRLHSDKIFSRRRIYTLRDLDELRRAQGRPDIDVVIDDLDDIVWAAIGVDLRHIRLATITGSAL